MKRLFKFFPLALLLACSSITDVTPGETFVKYFGDNAFFEIRDMISFTNADGDEEIVVLARRFGDYIPNPDIPDQVFSNVARFYVVHMDANGVLIEQKILDSDAADGFSDLNNLTQPSRITAIDNGFLVIGTHALDFGGGEEEPKYIYWAEFDLNFELVGLWNQIGDGVNKYYGVDIVQTSDGGVLVAGYTDANGDNDYYYEKVGGTEDPWARIQTRPGSDDQLVRVFPTSNGQYALIGQTDQLSDDGEGGANVERTNIGLNGTIQNSFVYGITRGININHYDIPQDVIERPNGFSIIGTSYTSPDVTETGAGWPFMMNVDLSGAVSVANYYVEDINEGATGDILANGYGVARLTNNNLLLVGSTDGFDDLPTSRETNDNGKELMYFVTDQGGTRISDIVQFGLVNGDDSGRKVIATSDGSALIAADYDFGGGLQQIAILKVNADGQLKQ